MTDGKRITPQIDGRHVEYLDELRDEPGVDSEAEAVRTAIDRAMHADARLHQRDAEVERVESLLDQRDARVEELRNELAAANSRIDASNELVERVEASNDLRSREQTVAERQERRRQASVVRRAWWWVAGTPGDSDAE